MTRFSQDSGDICRGFRFLAISTSRIPCYSTSMAFYQCIVPKSETLNQHHQNPVRISSFTHFFKMPILSQECHNYSSILVTGGKSILLNIVTIMAMTRLPLFIDYCHNIPCWRGALWAPSCCWRSWWMSCSGRSVRYNASMFG